MKRILTNLVLAFSLVFFSGLNIIPTALVSAATAPTPSNTANNGQALEIAPPVIELKADPGQSVKVQILLRNVSSGALVVSGQANDFVASGEGGTPKVLLNGETSPYSLKDWVIPPASLQLAPKEIKTMTITINVPSDGSPGGHYGIIRFTATAPSLSGTGVAISASLGSLILMTVNGPVNENLTVKEFSVAHGGRTGSLFDSTPLTFTTKLTNNGNVHEQPVGQVTIKDMFGKKFASVNVNLPPKNVLPQSTRKFESPLDKTVIGNKKMFGRYTADLTVKYGKNNDKTVTSSMSFWVIPIRTVVIAIAALIGAFFLVRYLLRRYNRYIINRSSRR